MISPRQNMAAVPHRPVIKGSMVLVVEDSRAMRTMLESRLLASGLDVVTAENGRQGLDLMRHIRFDLVVSDIAMPEMDGHDFCRAVRGSSEHADVPIIVISGLRDRENMARMHEVGVNGFLTKPFRVEQLLMMAESLLADRSALQAVERRRQEAEHSMTVGSVESLVQALGARDGYTYEHCLTVGRIAVGIGRALGLPPEELERLALAGRLHDLGKIGIPDSILLKPGRLTAEEFNVVKEHPGTGARILSAMPRLADIAIIVASHHERWDGGGYPLGLAGEAIPLLARIIAVADTYHALTSNRPYAEGVPHEQALRIIEENAGTQLCPQCVDVFLTKVGLFLALPKQTRGMQQAS